MPKHQHPKLGKEPPTVKTSLYLPRQTLIELKAVSDQSLIPMAALIRKGISMVIAEYAKKA